MDAIPPSGARSLPCLLGLALVAALLAGCATQPYSPITDDAFKGPTLRVVREDPDAYRGTGVRWGGSIATVENRQNETWIYVVEHPLGSGGRPHGALSSEGRFVARIPGFLDPDIYTKGREITVVGTVVSSLESSIGEYPYLYPVVAAQEYRLWEKHPPPAYYYPYYPYYPYYHYDPFWGPSYPWRYHRW